MRAINRGSREAGLSRVRLFALPPNYTRRLSHRLRHASAFPSSPSSTARYPSTIFPDRRVLLLFFSSSPSCLKSSRFLSLLGLSCGSCLQIRISESHESGRRRRASRSLSPPLAGKINFYVRETAACFSPSDLRLIKQDRRQTHKSRWENRRMRLVASSRVVIAASAAKNTPLPPRPSVGPASVYVSIG